jgi:hypothetical protein
VSPVAIKLIEEVSRWCLLNSSATFSCFYEYSAHVGSFEVAIYPYGWKADKGNIFNFEFDVAGRNYDEQRLKDDIEEFMSDCNKIKKESNNET